MDAPAGWAFEDPPNVAVITLRAIMQGTTWIAYVSRDEEDDVWQFHGPEESHVDNATVVALHRVLALDPSIADLPVPSAPGRRPGRGRDLRRRSAVLASLIVCASCASTQPNPIAPRPAQAPPGAASPNVEWRSVDRDGSTVLMAVARPPDRGPLPAVVILHGSHGFASEYVQLAEELSRGGVIAVAACWFAPGSGPGTRFVSSLPCPPATPPMPSHGSLQATRTIDAVVQAVRALPGVRPGRIALFGHSRGGGAAWNYVLQGGRVTAVILNSAGYPDELIRDAAKLDAPVLILHGEHDGPRDGSGGGAMTDVRHARAFHAALRAAGKPVEAVFYPGGRHNSFFSDRAQHAHEVERMQAFLKQHLRRK